MCVSVDGEKKNVLTLNGSFTERNTCKLSKNDDENEQQQKKNNEAKRTMMTIAAAVLALAWTNERIEWKKKEQLNHFEDDDEEMNGWVSLHAENV